MKGKVQTALGDVEPGDLGLVLPHEHFEVDSSKALFRPPTVRPEMTSCQFEMSNLGWIRQYPYSHKQNLNVSGLDIKNILVDEMKIFKANGGGTVVDNSTYCLGNEDRTSFAQKVTKSTGVHVILGTGFYVEPIQRESNLKLSQESMSEIIMKDLLEGCGGNVDAKCGILGEVGCSWPITDFEKRSVRAAAYVESVLGCPVMIHPGKNPRAPEEIIRIFTEAGGAANRVTMAHLDRTLYTNEDILEFAKLGTYLEYDLFGIEVSHYQQQVEVSMPSDAQRIDRLKLLIEEGYQDRLLISHDIHTRHRLESLGGHGFSHISTTVIPMMKIRGVTEDSIRRITVENPAKWLTFIK